MNGTLTSENEALPNGNDNGKRTFRCQFWRIDDNRFRNIREQSYCIQEQWPSYQLMHNASNKNSNRDSFNLAEYYAAMCLLFGESGDCYDDWKGAFSFPFEVKVFKGRQSFSYGLNVINWRSVVELRFFKILDQNDPSTDLSVYRKPIESEFSAREMVILDNFLCGYILGYKGSFKHRTIPSFFKKIDSNLITFGYVDGVFFEHQHETQETFTAEVDQYNHLDARQNPAIQWPECEFGKIVNVEVELDQDQDELMRDVRNA